MNDHGTNRRSLAETARLTTREFGCASSQPQSTELPSIGDVLRANGITPRSPRIVDGIDVDDLADTLAVLDRP